MGEQMELFELPPREDPGSVALAEILDAYELVSAEVGDPLRGTNSYIVVTDKPVQLAEELARGPELGSSSPSPWTAWTREEHNPKLRDKMGTTEYYRMKRVDGIIRGATRVFKTPPLSARWFMKPGGESKRDENVAKFVEDNLITGTHMNVSWHRLLEDILLMCEYGYMAFEKVYKLDSDGKVRLRKLAPRHPADVREFQFDSHGGPSALIMEPTEMNGMGEGIYIPISKLVIFSLEAEAGDLRGISILRSAYKHYVYKDTLYKIDAIQKERHGIGVPVIKLPPGFSPEDKRLAENMGRNLRTNERAHVVLPPNWELFFAKLEGQPVDCLKSIDHHNLMIMTNVLAPFLTEVGIDKESLETFYKATRYVATTVADTFNTHCIPDLVDYNYSRAKYPRLTVRRIGEWEDQRTQSFTLRNYVGAGLLRPDETLETFLRDENDLPPIDFETRQEAPTPQGVPGEEANVPNEPEPPRVGPPRQARASANSPRANAGRDRSGR